AQVTVNAASASPSAANSNTNVSLAGATNVTAEPAGPESNRRGAPAPATRVSDPYGLATDLKVISSASPAPSVTERVVRSGPARSTFSLLRLTAPQSISGS